MRRPRELTMDDVDQMVRSYQSGTSVYTLSERFGTRVQRVKKLLEWKGVELRPGSRGRKPGQEANTEAWEASEAASLQWLKEHGFR